MYTHKYKKHMHSYLTKAHRRLRPSTLSFRQFISFPTYIFSALYAFFCSCLKFRIDNKLNRNTLLSTILLSGYNLLMYCSQFSFRILTPEFNCCYFCMLALEFKGICSIVRGCTYEQESLASERK